MALGPCRFTNAADGTVDWTYPGPTIDMQSPTAAGAADGTVYEYYAQSLDMTQWEKGTGAYTASTGVFARTTVLANSLGTTAKISFTNPPEIVFYDLFAAPPAVSAVLYTSQSLTAAQQLQARTNLGMSPDVGKIELWPTSTLQAGRLKANGQSVSRTTYPALLAYLIASGTATFTNGSANVGMTAHNREPGDPIKLFTTGSLPTNFTAGTHGLPTVGTNYFVKTVVDANTVTLSATVGGSAITAGSAGSGTHTWVNAPSGDGDGSTTFTVPNLNGNFLRAWDDGAGVDANRTIGDTQLDAFQGHFHTDPTGTNYYYQRGTGGVIAGATGASIDRQTITIGAPITDGANGTPRTAAETRPRNVSLMATIRYSA